MESMIKTDLLPAIQALIIVGVIFRVVMKCIAAQSEEKSIKEALLGCKNVILAGLIGITISNMCTVIYAFYSASDSGKLLTSSLILGTVNLLKKVTAVIVTLEVTLTTYLMLQEGIAYQAAMAEEKNIHKKKLFAKMGIGIFVVCATALISTIAGYFQ